jgi:hypothetical protein
MFENLTIRDTLPIALMKRIFQVAVAAYFAIGLIAGYRAFWSRGRSRSRSIGWAKH